jgi:hypothetical protein
VSRYGARNIFDVSDVPVDPPVDRLDGALDVAVDVLRDYGGDPGMTRVERLARYLALNLGGEPYGYQQVGALAHWQVSFPKRQHHGEALDGTVDVWVIGPNVGLELQIAEGKSGACLSPDLARGVAVALLRAAEMTDR